MRATASFKVPEHVLRRQRELNVAARLCYALRNAAAGDMAADLEAIGDVYFQRALALGAEFDGCPSD